MLVATNHPFMTVLLNKQKRQSVITTLWRYFKKAD